MMLEVETNRIQVIVAPPLIGLAVSRTSALTPSFTAYQGLETAPRHVSL